MEIIAIDAATGQRVKNVLRVDIRGPHAGSADFNMLGPAGVATIDDLEIFEPAKRVNSSVR